MATLNEMIAQGAQFNIPDPTAQYNKLAQMQKYQQENELAKMQMEEYGRARQESNALRQFLPGLNENNRSQLLGFGAPGQSVYKTLAEGDRERRLAEQATSQDALHKSNILKNAVEQTRNAVAGIDPNDIESYAALRTGVLTQYPELTPYMPAAWDANVKQRLITTADSVLEKQKPRPPVILKPGDMAIPANDPRLTGTGVIAPAAARVAKAEPTTNEITNAKAIALGVGIEGSPEFNERFQTELAKLTDKKVTAAAEPTTNEIKNAMALALGSGPVGSFAYNERLQKELLRLTTKAEPITAPQALTTEERNARVIALGAGPEGSPAFNDALRTEISRMTAKPVPVAASEPTTNEIKNAKAIALGSGPEGSFAYNERLQKELARLTTKAEPITAPPAASTEMKNADAFARLKGEPGTPAYNAEFAKQMARLTAKSGGGEGGGGAGGAAGTGTVEVVDPKDRTKTIIVTKARAVAEGLTPAKAIEGLTPQMRQKLEASYPQATSSLRGHKNKTALFIKDVKVLRDSPGLDSVTGFAAGRAPGLTDAGRATVALYDKVVAKGGFQSLQDMRDMSKTGGALGNVSNKENEQLKASFAAIDRKQNANDVRTALDDLIKELEGGLGRLQDAYDLTYEYKRGTTAPAAGGVDANNPLLK